jgi:transposase-like protein/IS1 family transposase
MKSPCCQFEAKRFGKDRKGTQRYRCNDCGKTFALRTERPLDSMHLPVQKGIGALELLLEGCSVNTTQRLTGVHHTTILRLLVLAGEKCERLLGKKVVNVPVNEVQADEIWSFVGKKQKALRPGDDPNFGDAYCFVAMEKRTKLILNFALGKRDQATTNAFIEGLRLATSRQKFQITTDGFASYRSAITTTLHDRCDFAQLIKVYRATPEGERRYSPAEVVSTEVVPVMGDPDPEKICTSHIERQNLTMRMQMRRFTRLTNGFSKKWENHWAALCLWFAFYNFCRVHSKLRVTPAMEAGITDHIWSVRELLNEGAGTITKAA